MWESLQVSRPPESPESHVDTLSSIKQAGNKQVNKLVTLVTLKIITSVKEVRS